jgi:hypothetical protein
VHVAINLDVRVGDARPVERHFGQFACLAAGSTNLACFKVGAGRPEEYEFSVGECPAAWDVALSVQGSEWGRADLDRGVRSVLAYDLVVAAIRPPRDARAGRVAFRVARPRVGDRTLVELDLAQGVR